MTFILNILEYTVKNMNARVIYFLIYYQPLELCVVERSC